jgi:hypothetical protein
MDTLSRGLQRGTVKVASEGRHPDLMEVQNPFKPV